MSAFPIYLSPCDLARQACLCQCILREKMHFRSFVFCIIIKPKNNLPPLLLFWCEISLSSHCTQYCSWLKDEILPDFLISGHPGGRITYSAVFEKLPPIRHICAYIQVDKADYQTMPALPAFYTEWLPLAWL